MSINKEDRTFETRLLFIKELFTNTFSKDTIMTSCIQHKLKNSFNEYLKDIHRSYNRLAEKDPMAVLKRIDS